MLFNNFIKALSMNDLPPTLYSFMQSIVNYDNDDPVKIKDLAKYSRSKIFDFDYPISDNFNKEEFEILFLKHYMFRRINYDTLLSFKLHLEVKLNEIMPKYNLMLNGFDNINFNGEVETHLRNQNDSRTNNSTSSNKIDSSNNDNTTSTTKFSDTPQNRLEEVSSGEYVSEFTDVNNTGNATSTSSSSGTNSSTDIGKLTEDISITRGNSIDEYKKYLEVMNSIYSMIFRECDTLFYGVV